MISVYVLEATGSAFWVSAMLMLRMLPMGLFGMVGGVVAERVDRRRLLIGALLLSASISVTVAWLAATGQLQVWHAGTCAFIAGAVWMLDFPARRTLLGEVVGTSRVGSAMSLDIVAGSGTRALGPVVGGALYAAIGIGGAFAVSASLFVLAASGLVFLRTRDTKAAGESRGLLRQLSAGVEVLRGNQKMLGILAVTIVFNVWGFPFVSLVPVFGREILDLNAFQIGLLASAEGAGALVGAVVLAWVAKDRHFSLFYVGGVVVYLALVVAFAQSVTASLSAVLLLSIGLASAAFAAMQSALVLLNAPEDSRRQMMGLLSVCIGTGPIGFIHLGLLADWLGAPMACTIVAVEGLVALGWVLHRWRGVIHTDVAERSVTH